MSFIMDQSFIYLLFFYSFIHPYIFMCWLILGQFNINLIHLGKRGASNDKMSPADWPMNNFVVNFLTDYWCRRVQHTMDSQTLDCDSGFYKKQEEKSSTIKNVRNTSQASKENFPEFLLHLHRSLSEDYMIQNCKQNKLFPLQTVYGNGVWLQQ